MSEKKLMYGADALLMALKQLGIDYIFGNVGTDFPPIIASLSRFQQQGKLGVDVPMPMTIPHENVAINMANGYYLATGKPQVIFVHTNVGTANALMGIINANRAQIPMIVIAGRAPVTEQHDHRSKPGFIHWGQEMFDQGGIVRENVKWDYQISSDNVFEIDLILKRAVQMATSYPQGPVYLTFVPEVVDRQFEMSTTIQPALQNTEPQPDPAAIVRLAEWLAHAKRPLLITGGTSRDERILPALVSLVESKTVPITALLQRSIHFPFQHELYLGNNPHASLPDADLVISLETDVPYMPLHARPSDGCRVVHVGPDPVFQRYPRRGHQSDLNITSGIIPFLNALEKAVPTPKASMAQSRKVWAKEKRQSKEDKRARQVSRSQENDVMNFGWISHCIAELATQHNDLVVLREFDLDADFLPNDQPGSYYSLSNAGGLGWGLGNALGVRLAQPDKIPLIATGDGCYYFGNPTAAHSVAASQNLPFITVIYNNGKWATVANHTNRWYADLEEPEPPLTSLGQYSDFHKVCEAFGGYGEMVTKPSELLGALERAVTAVKNNQQALINVIVDSPIVRGEVH
ncbi:MAG: thiamine pyrophosphate-requiring protein [Chloroflexota bacterium]